MEKDKRYHVRRQYLISRKFQLKYVFLIVAFMFLIAWLAGYTVYYTAFTLMGEKLANVYPQGRLTVIFKTVNMALLMRILLLVPVVALISIFLSHRIAGPVFRIERYLGKVAKGDFSSIIRLRKRDELKNLAAAINKMTVGLGAIAQENQEIGAKLSSTLDKLNSELKQPSLDNEKVNTLVHEASEQARALEERLSQYSTTLSA